MLFLLFLLLPYCVYSITAYEARAMELKCNTLCNGKVDRRVCLKNCMASITNRFIHHGAKLTNKARKALLSVKRPQQKPKKKRRPKNRKRQFRKRQDIFKKKKPVKGRRIIRKFNNHRKRVN